MLAEQVTACELNARYFNSCELSAARGGHKCAKARSIRFLWLGASALATESVVSSYDMYCILQRHGAVAMEFCRCRYVVLRNTQFPLNDFEEGIWLFESQRYRKRYRFCSIYFTSVRGFQAPWLLLWSGVIRVVGRQSKLKEVYQPIIFDTTFAYFNNQSRKTLLSAV